MAFNLALSIKHSDKDINITCLYSEDALAMLDDHKKGYFDQLIKMPVSALTYDGKKDYFRAKMDMYENSPYDETLYLDVDMFWHEGRKINDLISIMSHWDYTMQVDDICDLGNTEALKKFNHWASGEDYKRLYGLGNTGKILNIGSYFVYFKKGGAFKELSQETIRLYELNKNAASYRGGQIADEHYWIAAMARTQLNPGPANEGRMFMPIAHQHYANWAQVKKWWGSTFPGKAGSVVRNHYQEHMKYYYRLARIPMDREYFEFNK